VIEFRRRIFVTASAAAAFALAPSVSAHNGAGPVIPAETPPDLALTFDNGAASSLVAALQGHVTAVQLMFTSCQATCPIQGALFAQAAKQLREGSSAQLVSISIDPARDTPEALREWMKRFGSSPRWRAARPDKQKLDALVAFLKSKQPGPDPHTAQVYYFNRKGELVLRSVDFPPASSIAKSLEDLSSRR
jgi:protein SCO1/2